MLLNAALQYFRQARSLYLRQDQPAAYRSDLVHGLIEARLDGDDFAFARLKDVVGLTNALLSSRNEANATCAGPSCRSAPMRRRWLSFSAVARCDARWRRSRSVSFCESSARKFVDTLSQGAALTFDGPAAPQNDCRKHDEEGSRESRNRKPRMETCLAQAPLEVIGDLMKFGTATT